jgi:hypothetical protein
MGETPGVKLNENVWGAGNVDPICQSKSAALEGG